VKQHKEADKDEVVTEQLEESKPSTSREEVSFERDTVETKPTEETEEDEQDITKIEITSDSKEKLRNDEEVVIYDEKTGEASEINIVGVNDAKDGINGDELGAGSDKVDEANKENIGEVCN
jgi:hypothetical protein